MATSAWRRSQICQRLWNSYMCLFTFSIIIDHLLDKIALLFSSVSWLAPWNMEPRLNVKWSLSYLRSQGYFPLHWGKCFASFAKEDWLRHNMHKKELDVTWFQIWSWVLKFTIFLCLSITHVLPLLSQKENGPFMVSKLFWKQDSTVTWSEIWLWKLQFTILIFFTPL